MQNTHTYLNLPDATAQLFTQNRGLLFSIAYRMLGSASDAEDIIQEAFVRWLQADSEEVRNPKAFLSTVVVRLCLDQLRSARAKRETYIGPWLPEPIPTGPGQEPDEKAMLAESLSFAFLIMLESLNPLERAVFLLREVFDYEYAEIAEIVGKSPANCRQILHRAHEHLGQRRHGSSVSREQQERLTTQFLQASTSGNIQGLLDILTGDIIFMADGGGKAKAGVKPVKGPENVARGMLASLRAIKGNLEAYIEEINGQPAIVGYLDGRPYGVIILDTDGTHIRRIYAVLNPDKLHRLSR